MVTQLIVVYCLIGLILELEWFHTNIYIFVNSDFISESVEEFHIEYSWSDSFNRKKKDLINHHIDGNVGSSTFKEDN